MPKHIKSVLFFLLLFFLSCKNDKNQNIHLKGDVFGTTYNILYDGQNDYELEIQAVFKSINQSLSVYDSTSLISRINFNQTDSLDNHLIKMIVLSKSIHNQTNGYFDPTVKPFLRLYDFFYNQNIDYKIPSQLEMDSVCLLVGLDKINVVDSKLTKSISGMELDFNAIAKGYAVDLVGDFLTQNGVDNFLVEIGGEILANGKKNNADFWRIGIENPIAKGNERNVLGTVSANRLAMATSGNYRKFFLEKKSNTKIVHTVNPKLCNATASDLLSVSVIAKDCASADAYATALMAMGKRKSLKFLEENKNIQAFLIYYNQENLEKVETQSINGFPLTPL